MLEEKFSFKLGAPAPDVHQSVPESVISSVALLVAGHLRCWASVNLRSSASWNALDIDVLLLRHFDDLSDNLVLSLWLFSFFTEGLLIISCGDISYDCSLLLRPEDFDTLSPGSWVVKLTSSYLQRW